jgi:hypothetical protein
MIGREIELYDRLFIGTAKRFPAILAWWPSGATAIQIVGCHKQVTIIAREILPPNGGHSLKRKRKAKSKSADCSRAGIAA